MGTERIPVVATVYFENIIGHKSIKEQLCRIIAEGRLPHAVIFSGASGLGKTMMACAVASTLIGRSVFSNLDTREAVPLLADRDDAFYVSPVGTMLKVDQFRQLQGQLMLQGRKGQPRVAIIDHVETMNTEFANRMLKILEEPPKGVYFILITDQPALLLPTIISRCAVVRFEPVPDEEMAEELMRLYGGTAAEYEKAVLWGDGIVRTVLEFLAGSGQDSMQRALDFLVIMATHSCPYAKWLSLSGMLSDTETIEILRWIIIFQRDMIVLRSGSAAYVRLSPYIHEMAKLLPHWSDTGLFQNLKTAENGLEAMKRHVNMRLVWDYVSLECIKTKGGN